MSSVVFWVKSRSLHFLLFFWCNLYGLCAFPYISVSVTLDNNAISLNLSAFSVINPKAWFRQTETASNIRCISSKGIRHSGSTIWVWESRLKIWLTLVPTKDPQASLKQVVTQRARKNTVQIIHIDWIGLSKLFTTDVPCQVNSGGSPNWRCFLPRTMGR